MLSENQFRGSRLYPNNVTGTEEKQNFPFHSQQKLSSSSTQTSEYFLASKAELFPRPRKTGKSWMVPITHGSVIYHHHSAADGSGAPSLVALSHPLLLLPWGISDVFPSLHGMHKRKWALLSVFGASKEVLSMRIDWLRISSHCKAGWWIFKLNWKLFIKIPPISPLK